MQRHQTKDAELLTALGKNIAKFVKKRGFETTEKFAWEVGIQKSTLSRVIRGKADVRISKVARIAKALQVKIDDLIKP